VGAFAFAAMVVLLLLLNGAELARIQLARDDVDAVLTDWTDRHPEFRVDDVRQTGDAGLEIDLIGRGARPSWSAWRVT